MAKTPKKLVHWALEVSLSDLGSPFSAQGLGSPGSDGEQDSTRSLEYINAQLIAHGFTYKPGLSLEGVGREDGERVVKCLVAMLGQRVVSSYLSRFKARVRRAMANGTGGHGRTICRGQKICRRRSARWLTTMNGSSRCTGPRPTTSQPQNARRVPVKRVSRMCPLFMLQSDLLTSDHYLQKPITHPHNHYHRPQNHHRRAPTHPHSPASCPRRTHHRDQEAGERQGARARAVE